MKKLMTLAFILCASTAFAQDVEPQYYAPEFKIVDVSPMCPRSIPTRAVCMGLGSIVTVETTLGCLDKLVFSEFSERRNFGVVELHAVGVAKKHPKSDVVRCVRPNTIRKQVNVMALGELVLVNQQIAQY